MAEDIIPVNQPASLEVYDRIGDPISAIKTLGGAIFKSGIFGLDKPEQGEILAMQCLTERKSPLELARTYHFIQGQLAIRSDALLAKYHQAGGSVTWIERTDEKVKAEFRKGSSSAIIVADLKEYVSNGTAVGRDGKFKDASVFYNQVSEVELDDLMRWIQKARSIQWDYKNIVQRKGVLERIHPTL